MRFKQIFMALSIFSLNFKYSLSSPLNSASSVMSFQLISRLIELFQLHSGWVHLGPKSQQGWLEGRKYHKVTTYWTNWNGASELQGRWECHAINLRPSGLCLHCLDLLLTLAPRVVTAESQRKARVSFFFCCTYRAYHLQDLSERQKRENTN